jgi:thiamine kinase-like enzyme
MAVDDQLLDSILGLGWGLQPPAKRLAGSLSGAGVFRVQTPSDDDVVVKVALNGPIRHLAQRELDFYQELSSRVPVLTPRLLRHTANDELIALMLSAHTPMPPAREWRGDAWLDVARQLAMLHATPLSDRERWTMPSWLESTMRHPPTGVAETYWSGTVAASWIDGIVRNIDDLNDVRARTQHTLTHGDCHADNFLSIGEQLVWSDWQAITVGNPADEMAFLWSRANSDGAVLPYAAMLEAYLDESGADAAGRQTFPQSVLAAEIGILLFGWPMYAGYHPRDEQDRVTHRVIDLIDTWQRRT